MIVVVEPAVAYGETNMYKNNTYRVREGVVNLTMINPTPIASVYDIVYSIRSAIAPKDDPVSFVTEGLTQAIKCRHGKVATHFTLSNISLLYMVTWSEYFLLN